MAFHVSSKLKLGVLAPSSNFVPHLAGDMLAALELGLAEARLDAELIIESAGYNADLKMIVPAIQQLILAKRVNSIIAPLNIAVIESVAGYCESQEVPLIALNLTEDPLSESAQNPFVFVNSFYLWHSAWMSGYLAAQKFGSQGASMAAIHDGGYGLLFAFQLGLEAGQGTLLHTAITHRNSSTEDPAESIAEVGAQKPDFIFALYSGKEAVSFLKAYQSSGYKDQIPIITLAPMVSQNIRRNTGDAIRNIWYVTGENYEGTGKDVINSLTAAIGREPNPYALLAYESAHLIAAAAGKIEDSIESPPEALRQSEFKSPRGIVKFNDDLNIASLFYLRQITAENETVEELSAPPIMHEQYRLACQKLAKQGWVNPYLCA